jgi:mannose-6-phosphate isomerase-like protein (cupin superfamily)
MSDYTVLRTADAPDYTEGKDPGHQFLGYGALGSDQVSMNVITLDPGAVHKVPGMPDDMGHSHEDIDEIYVVASGEIACKLDDDELTLGPLDAVRIPPAIKRATRNVSDAPATLIMFSQKMTDPRAQSHFHEGFWPR